MADEGEFARAICAALGPPLVDRQYAHIYVREVRYRFAEISLNLVQSISPETRAIGALGLSRCDLSARAFLRADNRLEGIECLIRAVGILSRTAILTDRYLLLYYGMAVSGRYLPCIKLEMYNIDCHGLGNLYCIARSPCAPASTQIMAIYIMFINKISIAPDLWAFVDSALDADPTLEYAYVLRALQFEDNPARAPRLLRGKPVSSAMDVLLAGMCQLPYSEPISCKLRATYSRLPTPSLKESGRCRIRQFAAEVDFHPDGLAATLLERPPADEPWSEARHAALDRHYPLNRLLAAALLGMERLRAAGVLRRSDPDVWGETFTGLTFADTLADTLADPWAPARPN